MFHAWQGLSDSFGKSSKGVVSIMLFAHSFTFEGRLVGTRAIEEVSCAYHKYVVSSKNLGRFPLGGSGFGFVIQDYTDHGASKERSFSSSQQLPWQQARNCRAPQRNRALNLKTKTRWPSWIEQLKYLLVCNWAPLGKMINFGSVAQSAFDRSLIWKWICSKGTPQIRNPDPDSPKGTHPYSRVNHLARQFLEREIRNENKFFVDERVS